VPESDENQQHDRDPGHRGQPSLVVSRSTGVPGSGGAAALRVVDGDQPATAGAASAPLCPAAPRPIMGRTQYNNIWFDRFFLSTDAYAQRQRHIHRRSLQADNFTLAAGASYPRAPNIQLPAVALGDYYVILVTDGSGIACRRATRPTTIAVPITVGQADLGPAGGVRQARAAAGRGARGGPSRAPNRLAGLLYFKGDRAGAEPLSRRVLARARKTARRQSSRHAGDLQALAGLQRAPGTLPRRRPLSPRPRQPRQLLGADHPQTLESLYNLAFLRARRRPVAAEAAIATSRAVRARPRPRAPPRRPASTPSPSCSPTKGNLRAPRRSDRRVLAAQERLPSRNASTLLTASNLGLLLPGWANSVAAEALQRQVSPSFPWFSVWVLLGWLSCWTLARRQCWRNGHCEMNCAAMRLHGRC